MKTGTLLMVMSIYLVTSGVVVSAQTIHVDCECTGTCQGDELTTTGEGRFGVNLQVYALIAALPPPIDINGLVVLLGMDAINGVTADVYAKKHCLERWGAACGVTSDFREYCPANCATWCDGLNEAEQVSIALDLLEMKVDVKDACVTSCESKCELNEMIYDLAEMIYYFVGIVAAIMFVINGFKFMTSTNPEDRDNAKQGFMYVILALIIIAIAGSLVNLLFSGSLAGGGLNSTPAYVCTVTW
ncbi:MAG: hypothetical protein KAU03_02695 [Candidatus Altiarchaeales archaeon]|nr:hypothetical protein [Candidatus Altiarchaeales archaeon]